MAGRGPNKPSPHDWSVEDFLDRLDSLSNDRLFSEHHAAAMVGKSVKTLQEERRIFNRTRERNPADAEALKRLELQVAGEHYKRAELDARFERLENAIREEMRGLGRKFDAVASAITERKTDG